MEGITYYHCIVCRRVYAAGQNLTKKDKHVYYGFCDRCSGGKK